MIRKQDEVITIEDDDDNVVPGVFVKEDPIDAFSLSEEGNFPGQEMVNPGKNDEISNEGESLGQGKRNIKPRTLFSPKMKGKTHGSKIFKGGGIPTG